MLAIFACALALEAFAPDRYAAAVQEDATLEWASFWAFALAAAVFLLAARARVRAPAWPLVATAALCGFVAMEEISWGQRLLGYRPPTYFLEHNFQQELNLHNLVATDLRKLSLLGVILGFGVALPLAARVAIVGPALERLGAPRPPPWLAPAFLAMAGFYAWYPLRFSGEWVECALGVGFLFAACDEWRGARSHPAARPAGVRALLGSFSLVLALGVGTTHASRIWAREDPRLVAAASQEAGALAADFSDGLAAGHCGMHKRLYTYVIEREQDALRTGRFAQVAEPARAAFFLDPWSMPWWVRHVCDDAGETLVVYSFGPNRRRDSTAAALAGDDVGVRLVRGAAASRWVAADAE